MTLTGGGPRNGGLPTPLATKGYGEGDTALAMLRDEWRENVAPLLDEKLAVLTGDAAYSKGELRAEFREAGIVENVHPVSHGYSETNKANVERAEQTVFQIQDYPNWRANGHRELYCACGQGKTITRINRNKKGRAVVRVEGECQSCGSITITSGKWRLTGKRFVRCQPGEENKADWLFGNPFTFNAPIAVKFGNNRFGHGEGFHGHLVTRFGLLKGKAWYRRREQAQLDFLMVFSAMHALAIEQRSRAKAKAPPGLAAAA